MKLPHYLLTLLAVIAFSCESLKRVPASTAQYTAKYNASIQANRMYEVARTARAFAESNPDYISIANQINWFTANDSLRSNKMYRQDTILRNAWMEKWQYHRKKGTLSISEINSNQLYIAGLFAPVLNSER